MGITASFSRSILWRTTLLTATLETKPCFPLAGESLATPNALYTESCTIVVTLTIYDNMISQTNNNRYQMIFQTNNNRYQWLHIVLKALAVVHTTLRYPFFSNTEAVASHICSALDGHHYLVACA